MTPDDAIRFAKALPPDQNVYDRLDTIKELLYALEEAAGPRVIRQARKILLDKAEAFRRGDAPGHMTWYQHHLRAAALASERWAKKAVGLTR